MFTVREEKSRAISIITGTLNPTITSTDSAFANNQIVVPASTTKELTIKLTNNNNRDAKFNFYYKGDLPTGVSIGYVKSTKSIPPDGNGIVISQGNSEEYTIKIKNNSSASFTLQIGSDGGLSNQPLSFPTNGHIFELLDDSTGVETLLAKSNPISNTDYTTSKEEEQKEMYAFTHETGAQQTGWTKEELTDYRYIGKDLNNHIVFNGYDWWRIVGVFTVENERGEKERRIKIMRYYASIVMSWSKDGINDWLNADVKTELNNTWYYKGDYDQYYGLKSEARSQIGNVKWYLGGPKNASGNGAASYYTFERSNTVYSGRSKSWIGVIGLMYPSDYAYTYAYGVDDKCYSDTSQCSDTYGGDPGSGWMWNINGNWTITPSSGSSSNVFWLNSSGYMSNLAANGQAEARPCVYLNSDIRIISGNGTSDSPYIIQ